MIHYNSPDKAKSYVQKKIMKGCTGEKGCNFYLFIFFITSAMYRSIEKNNSRRQNI